jgi:hypothetical protein
MSKLQRYDKGWDDDLERDDEGDYCLFEEADELVEKLKTKLDQALRLLDTNDRAWLFNEWKQH